MPEWIFSRVARVDIAKGQQLSLSNATQLYAIDCCPEGGGGVWDSIRFHLEHGSSVSFGEAPEDGEASARVYAEQPEGAPDEDWIVSATLHKDYACLAKEYDDLYVLHEQQEEEVEELQGRASEMEGELAFLREEKVRLERAFEQSERDRRLDFAKMMQTNRNKRDAMAKNKELEDERDLLRRRVHDFGLEDSSLNQSVRSQSKGEDDAHHEIVLLSSADGWHRHIEMEVRGCAPDIIEPFGHEVLGCGREDMASDDSDRFYEGQVTAMTNSQLAHILHDYTELQKEHEDNFEAGMSLELAGEVKRLTRENRALAAEYAARARARSEGRHRRLSTIEVKAMDDADLEHVLEEFHHLQVEQDAMERGNVREGEVLGAREALLENIEDVNLALQEMGAAAERQADVREDMSLLELHAALGEALGAVLHCALGPAAPATQESAADVLCDLLDEYEVLVEERRARALAEESLPSPLARENLRNMADEELDVVLDHVRALEVEHEALRRERMLLGDVLTAKAVLRNVLELHGDAGDSDGTCTRELLAAVVEAYQGVLLEGGARQAALLRAEGRVSAGDVRRMSNEELEAHVEEHCCLQAEVEGMAAAAQLREATLGELLDEYDALRGTRDARAAARAEVAAQGRVHSLSSLRDMSDEELQIVADELNEQRVEQVALRAEGLRLRDLGPVHDALKDVHEQKHVPHEDLSSMTLDGARAELDELVEAYQNLRAEYTEMNKAHSLLQRSTAAREAENVALKEMHEKARTELKEVLGEHEELRAEHKEMVEKHMTLQETAAAREAEIQDLNTMHSALKDLHDEKHVAHEDLATENMTLKDMHDKARTELGELVGEYEKLREEHKEMVEKHMTLQETTAAREAEIQDLNTMHSALKDLHEEKHVAHEDLATENMTLKDMHDKTRTELGELVGEYEKLREEHKEMVEKHMTLQETTAAREAEVADLNAVHDALQEAHAEHSVKHVELHSDHMTLQELHSQMKKELAELLEDYRAIQEEHKETVRTREIELADLREIHFALQEMHEGTSTERDYHYGEHMTLLEIHDAMRAELIELFDSHQGVRKEQENTKEEERVRYRERIEELEQLLRGAIKERDVVVSADSVRQAVAAMRIPAASLSTMDDDALADLLSSINALHAAAPQPGSSARASEVDLLAEALRRCKEKLHRARHRLLESTVATSSPRPSRIPHEDSRSHDAVCDQDLRSMARELRAFRGAEGARQAAVERLGRREMTDARIRHMTTKEVKELSMVFNGMVADLAVFDADGLSVPAVSQLKEEEGECEMQVTRCLECLGVAVSGVDLGLEDDEEASWHCLPLRAVLDRRRAQIRALMDEIEASAGSWELLCA